METLNQNRNCQTAVELYHVAVQEAEKIEKAKNRREREPNIFLTPNHKESRFYDWDIFREFFNWLKQLNKDSSYTPNPDETAFLEEIECALILKESGLGNRIPSNEERDWIIKILNQRIDIRDSALPPDDYCKIDDRLPLDLVSEDDCKRIYFEIYPEGKKNWTPIVMPVSKYYKFTPPSDIKIQTVGEAAASSNVPPLNNTQEQLDKEFLAQFELDPTKEDEPIQYCFEVGGVPTFPKGDIQGNKGLQKNGKTFAEVLFMGAALKGEYLGVKCLIPNAKVLFLDSEQHPRNTRLAYRRVCQIAGINGRERHERLNMLHLRLSENVETTRKAIRLKIKYFRPDIVFLDGIVDCISDFNDPTESKQYLTELAKIALEYNCAICCTLHTNPSDETKMRGHLGTMLAQKASDVIQCIKSKKDDGSVVFEVEQTENRNNADFSKFAFAIEMRKDVSGEPISVPVKSYVSVKEKADLDELFRWALYNNPMRRADLKDKIISDDCPQKVSRSTAYQRINDAIAAGIVADDNIVTHQLRYVGLDLSNEDGMPF